MTREEWNAHVVKYLPHYILTGFVVTLGLIFMLNQVLVEKKPVIQMATYPYEAIDWEARRPL